MTLPNLAIVPVTESDSAVTNYAMEQWCIAEQPALWTAFVNAQESQSGGPTDGVPLSPSIPYPNWPGITGGLDDQSTTAVAADVESESGGIGRYNRSTPRTLERSTPPRTSPWSRTPAGTSPPPRPST